MTRPLRTPILALAVVALGLLVVGGILLAGRIGVPEAPTASAAPASATPSPSATDPRSTPEGAVRAFFAAFATARRSDDPSAIADLVTGPDSSAYLSVAGFLDGQKAAGKASILTVVRLDGLTSAVSGDAATVTFAYTEGGYDVSLAGASPLQTPQLLPARQVTVRLRRAGSVWLVDAYESAP
jgi:hypothetical protein